MMGFLSPGPFVQGGGLHQRSPAVLARSGAFRLPSLFASGGDGLLFDFSRYDGQFQENTGPTAADDVGEVIGFSPDRHSWSGVSYAALLAAQPEMVVPASWSMSTNGGTGTATNTDGVLSVAGDGVNAGQGTQAFTTVAGAAYRLSFTLADNDVAVAQTGVTSYGSYAPGQRSIVVEAASTTTTIRFFRTSTGLATVSNISLKYIPGHHGLQSSASLRPTVQTTGAKFDGTDDNLLTNYTAGSGANYIVALVTVPGTVPATQIIAGMTGAAASNRLFFGVVPSGELLLGTGNETPTVTGSNLLGQTLVVGISLDGAGGVAGFIGNAPPYTGAYTGGPTTSTPMRLGCRNNGGTADLFFAGSIKKLVAGREALTISRYRQIRNAMLAS